LQFETNPVNLKSQTSRFRNFDGSLIRKGNALIDIELRADAIRTVRIAIMNLVYAIAREPQTVGYLVLAGSRITEDRLKAEWQRADAILKREVLNRLTICLEEDGRLHGIQRELPQAMHAVIENEVRMAWAGAPAQSKRADYSFIVRKILLHQWLTSGEPVTTDWLGRTAGCSYPTVARVLKELGSVVERASDRRVRLRYFPQEEFERMAANAEVARLTVRFVDRSGQPRSPEARVRRLEKMRPAGVAIGGVLGARHYYSELDLVGTPRLDLSLHCGEATPGLEFVKELDPALEREDDPRAPASVVVHAVRHADALFQLRQGGLYWADPVDCLLDLRESRLESQANQFLEALKSGRKSKP